MTQSLFPAKRPKFLPEQVVTTFVALLSMPAQKGTSYCA